MNAAESDRALSNWSALNRALRSTLDEGKVFALLERELKTHRRPMYALRIHSRFNTIRAARERVDIAAITNAETRAPTKMSTFGMTSRMIAAERAAAK